MRWQDFIEHNPNVMLGKPCIKGTRITVEHLLQRLGDGWTDNDLLKSYPHLTTEHLRAAQAYAAAALGRDELIFADESG